MKFNIWSPRIKRCLSATYFKNDYFDNIVYADTFYVIQNLRYLASAKGITKLSIENPTGKYVINLDKLKEIIFYTFRNKKIYVTLCLNQRRAVTQEEIQQALKENQDAAAAGHCGFHKMYARMKGKYTSPEMKSVIRNYIRNCSSCNLQKIDRNPMCITDTPHHRAWEKVSIDVVGKLPDE